MQQLVFLLRAVNVGGNGKLPMADLRAMAEACGLREARTRSGKDGARDPACRDGMQDVRSGVLHWVEERDAG
ncbi:DUF1697 domain-containing protein [Stappia sp.]|uniref:DUF1697 domain-containing protein n=1 Tax=Stappia sp. TaxID=1870903 RepID=UPI003D125C5C